MNERVLMVPGLADMEWPEDAIFIADYGLPGGILCHVVDPILVDAGEPLKRLSRVGELAEEVLSRRASKPLTLVAVGGGSVGDAVGFLASILWRGVTLWHVPTTLVAMVDSAHGGKTAVNLGAAKNQLGTFYEADRVIIARDVLFDLPLPQRQEGLAELIKGLWLGDVEALATVDARVQELASAPRQRIEEDLWRILERAIQVKYRIVASDKFETKGVRTFLNFGHTIAHVLELEFGLSHGVAVAWGMYVAAGLSCARQGFPEAQVRRLRAHLEPLLLPMESLRESMTLERFEEIARKDKKRVASTLRSVLLRAPGDPVVVTDVAPADWYDALVADHSAWLTAPRRVDWTSPSPAMLSIAASKSELNRALLIAHLREGTTHVEGESEAADVAHLRRGLAMMKASPLDELTLTVGMGGTTFRFILMAAAIRQAPTRIMAHPRLLARPQRPIYDILEQLGARVTVHEDGVTVTPSRSHDGATLRVRCEESSQFASAAAMLAASNASILLELSTDDRGDFELEKMASKPYFEMTLEMLARVGVVVRWEGGQVSLDGAASERRSASLRATPDESSSAVWRVAAYLGAPVTLSHTSSSSSRQPDGVLSELLERFAAASAEETVVIDLHDAPDLAPVLTAAAVFSAPALEIRGASHLRLKESNRIEDLCEAYSRVGIEVAAREDGLYVPAGVQRPEEGARWPTFHDHRLAMTGALLALQAPLEIDAPWVVAKSYPRFWSDLRRAGARITRGE